MAAQYPKEILIIFIPSDAKFNIVSRGESVQIENDIAVLGVDISNADLVMQNADRATIKCDFGSVTAGFIDHADINISNTKFVCRETGSFTIDSKHSTVTFTKSRTIAFKSVGDQYTIQQVKDIKGDKQFGAIAVANVKNSFVLTGSSADISISNVDQAASLVKIDNKYASVQLQLHNSPNYTLNYLGEGSRVAGTQLLKGKEGPKKLFIPAGGYTASAGNLAGQHTSFQINCNNCALELQ